MGEPIIDIRSVYFRYPSSEEEGTGRVRRPWSLEDVSLQIFEGEMVAIVGHNGSGKSTLARHLNGLLLPVEGAVTVEGMDTKEEALLPGIRRTVGCVFQNPDNQMVTSVVEEDVAFGPENLGLPPAEIRRRVDLALAQVGMSGYAARGVNELSGGQKQRIAIAGMLAMSPKVLVLDEATAMLDPGGRESVLWVARELHRTQGMTVVMITQYMEEVTACDRVVVMHEGRVVRTGTPREIFADPAALRDVGLDVPEAVELRERLKAGGLELSGDPMTIEELADSICRS